MVGKQAQLARGPSALALKPRRRQPGLSCADLGDRIAARLDLVRDLPQKGRPCRTRQDTVAGERRLRRCHGLVDMIRRPDGETPGRALDRGILERVSASDPCPCDQMSALGHGVPFLPVIRPSPQPGPPRQR